MNTILSGVKGNLLLLLIIFTSGYCSGQDLVVQSYDTSYTRYFLKGRLLETFDSEKDDFAHVSIMFFQIINKKQYKSFLMKQRGNGWCVKVFSKDSVFFKENFKIVDSASIRNVLSRIDKDLDISGKVTTSTYSIIVFIRVGDRSYQVKTTNLAFFSNPNPYIEAIKKVLSLINIDYRDFIGEFVDG